MSEARRSRHELLYSSTVVPRYSYEKSIALSQLPGGMAYGRLRFAAYEAFRPGE